MAQMRKKIKKSVFENDAPRRTLHKNLEFTATEQYKLLRTNLDFTLPEGVKCPIVCITSPMRGEGKSTTSINLSYVLAERGSKVLLIDGDLRIPSIAKKLGVDSTPGLTDMIMGNSFDIESLKTNVLENWYVLPSGKIPPNPSELLGSERMSCLLRALQEKFEYIIIDLPPVNIVSDALSISKLSTGMLLVIREETTEKKSLEHCIRQLELSGANLLGCVMNETKSGGGSYGKYKSYKYKSYK